MAARGDLELNSSDGSSDDEEPHYHQNIKLLYSIFERCKWNKSADACNNILQEFASTFVGCTFEEYIKEFMSRNDAMQGQSAEQIHKLDAELKTKCRVNKRPYGIDTYKQNIYGCRQWMYYAATKCMSFHPTKYLRHTRQNDAMVICNIGLLNVPALLDIMWNCKLFDHVRGYIETIVDAYVECDSSARGLHSLTNKLVSSMKAFLENIDDKMLPDRVRYLLQLTNIGEYWDRISTHNGETTPTCLSNEEENRVLSVVKDLQNPDYHNWMKGILTLKYANDGARYFDVMIFQEFLIKCLPNGGSHFEDGEYIQKMCKEICESTNWKKTQLHCTDCKILFDEVEKLQKSPLFQKPNHSGFYSGVFNCKDIPVGGAWGIAKLFMPRDYGKVTTPDDSDTQALFRIILNCKLFSKCNYENIEKIIKLRNDLMHSPKFTFTAELFTELYDSVNKFIEEAINQLQKNDQEVRQKLVSSMENIEQIRPSVIEVDSIIELGKTAMEYEYEELEKQKGREDSEASAQLHERQTLIEIKLQCYRHVENSSLFSEFKNMALFNNDEIKELRRKVHAQEQRIKDFSEKQLTQEQTNEELSGKLLAQEQTNDELSGKLLTQEQTNEELSEKLHAQEQTNEGLNGRLLALKQTNEELSGKLHAQEQTNEELSGKLHVQEQTNEELSGKLHAQEQTNEELSGKLHAQEQTNEELSGKLHAQEQTNEELSGKLHAQEQTNED